MKLSDLKRRDRRLLGDFWKVGLPIVFHELIWSTGTTAGSSVTGQMGTTIVAGYNIANVYYQLMACVTNAILIPAPRPSERPLAPGRLRTGSRRKRTVWCSSAWSAGLLWGS